MDDPQGTETESADVPWISEYHGTSPKACLAFVLEYTN
jgi:hypothetical protein